MLTPGSGLSAGKSDCQSHPRPPEQKLHSHSEVCADELLHCAVDDLCLLIKAHKRIVRCATKLAEQNEQRTSVERQRRVLHDFLRPRVNFERVTSRSHPACHDQIGVGVHLPERTFVEALQYGYPQTLERKVGLNMGALSWTEGKEEANSSRKCLFMG